ncbi:MAG TPA: hypothetical protein VFB16_03130 [Bauldia sp.]|nr:hypothetical protein [Bauldia sp.]
MRISGKLAAILLPILTAGCYTSAVPLISADKAVFPYETITYSEAGKNEPYTMKHEGDAYVMKSDKGESVMLRFMPVKDDVYVAMMGGKTDKGEAYLYALVKLDAAGKKANGYAMIADKSDFGPTLKACADADTSVCLTDLQPFIDHALPMTAGEPMVKYDLIDLK